MVVSAPVEGGLAPVRPQAWFDGHLNFLWVLLFVVLIVMTPQSTSLVLSCSLAVVAVFLAIAGKLLARIYIYGPSNSASNSHGSSRAAPGSTLPACKQPGGRASLGSCSSGSGYGSSSLRRTSSSIPTAPAAGVAAAVPALQQRSLLPNGTLLRSSSNSSNSSSGGSSGGHGQRGAAATSGRPHQTQQQLGGMPGHEGHEGLPNSAEARQAVPQGASQLAPHAAGCGERHASTGTSFAQRQQVKRSTAGPAPGSSAAAPSCGIASTSALVAAPAKPGPEAPTTSTCMAVPSMQSRSPAAEQAQPHTASTHRQPCAQQLLATSASGTAQPSMHAPASGHSHSPAHRTTLSLSKPAPVLTSTVARVPSKHAPCTVWQRPLQGMWCSIPEAVYGMVLAQLPPADIMSVRVTCREWRRLCGACLTQLQPSQLPAAQLVGLFPHLQRLDLSRLTHAPRPSYLRHLLRHLHSLQELQLGSNSNGSSGSSGGGGWGGVAPCVGDRCLLEVAQQQAAAHAKLHSLGLAQCMRITDSGLVALASMTRLTSLQLPGCVSVSDVGILLLSQLPQLTSLDLAWCLKTSNAGLKALSATHATLRKLDISGCPLLTEPGLISLSSLTQLQHLVATHLGLAQAQPSLTDPVLAAWAPLSSLTTLAFGAMQPGVAEVSDASLLALPFHHPRLAHLALTCLDLVTDAGVEGLLQGLSATLIRLTLRSCHAVTAGCLAAARALPHLLDLDLLGCVGVPLSPQHLSRLLGPAHVAPASIPAAADAAAPVALMADAAAAARDAAPASLQAAVVAAVASDAPSSEVTAGAAAVPGALPAAPAAAAATDAGPAAATSGPTAPAAPESTDAVASSAASTQQTADGGLTTPDTPLPAAAAPAASAAPATAGPALRSLVLGSLTPGPVAVADACPDDACLALLAPLHASLESLTLGNFCGSLASPGVTAALSSLSRLTSLELHGCMHVKDDGLWHLAAACFAPRLQRLCLARLGPACSPHEMHTLLCACPRLTQLSLRSCGLCITDEVLLAACSSLTALTSLAVTQAPAVTDAGLRNLSCLARLCELEVSCCDEVTAHGMLKGPAQPARHALPAIKGSSEEQRGSQLHPVSVVGPTPPASAAAPSANSAGQQLQQQQELANASPASRLGAGDMRHLRTVSLACTSVDAQGVAALCARAPHLISLDLSECVYMCDEAAQQLPQLRQLISLDLCQCSRLTDAALSHLALLTQLVTLRLNGCVRLSDEGVAHLCQLPLLTLHVDKCIRMTDVGVTRLAQIGSLTSLRLARCPEVSDEGVAALARLTRLSTLSLAHNERVTDAGLMALSHITCLATLEF